MRLDDVSAELATAIRKSLEEFKLKQWGFVIFRCTYKSQEKWDKFVTLAKEDAHNYFEWTGTEDVYDKMEWTIIEDAETLDGASIVETSHRFRQWVETKGREEMQGSIFADGLPGSWRSRPRYCFFIHVDEETLESVADNEKARETSGYFATIVREDAVLIREQEQEARTNGEGEIQDGEDGEIDLDEEEDDEEDELLDVRKRVKLDALVDLYVLLLDTGNYQWYNIWVPPETGVAAPF